MKKSETLSAIRIGVDLMGSDTAPEAFLKAMCLFAEEEKSRVHFVVLASPQVLQNAPPFFETCIAEEFISMEESPFVVLRNKTNSSLCLGMKLLQEKKIHALVSAGHTGALLVSAKTLLAPLPGIKRPALLSLFPTTGREVAVLDIGANLSSQPVHLLQFAMMGIAYQKSRGIELPTVGLLNIGSEEKKGTPKLRDASLKLEALNKEGAALFIGNIEGKQVFKGNVDVLVTDGFTGNVFLKTSEGIAAFVLDELEQETTRYGSPPYLKTILSKLRHRLHYVEFPGAILCGVDGIVIKCHGDSTPETLIKGIKGAIRIVENQFLEKIKKQLESLQHLVF